MTTAIRLDGEGAAWPHEPRCRCCTSEHRADIERLLLAGRTMTDVISALPAAGLSEDSLYRHRARHMPVSALALQQVQQQEQAALVDVVLPAVASLARTVAFSRAVLVRATERLAAHEIEPSVQDALAAERLVIDVERDADAGPDHEQLVTALNAAVEVCRSMLTDEQKEVFRDRLHARPEMRAIAAARTSR